MKELVMDMINISGQAAIIFVVLLAARGIFALGRIPKKYAYGLWAILFIRLLLPLQLEARWGLMPRESGLVRAVENMLEAAERVEPVLGHPAGDGLYDEEQDVSAKWKNMFGRQVISANGYDMFEGGEDAQSARLGNAALQAPVPYVKSDETIAKGQEDAAKGRFMVKPEETIRGGQTAATGKGQAAAPTEDAGFWQFSPWTVIVGIWITVCALLIGYGLLSYLKLKKKLCCSLRLEGWGDGIYLADGIETPFVLGFIAPKIYLPSDMAGKNYPYVIAHERIHIRRRDYLFKLGAYLLTCLYWFHPMVWAGFILMGRDMEMSCDEAVLRRMDGDCRGEYADSLLRLSCEQQYPAAAPLAFGEGDTRGRIKHIMGYRKAAAAAALAAVALTGILAAVLLASPREAAGEGEPIQFSSLPKEEADLLQDSQPMGLTGENPSGTGMEQRTADNGGQEFSFQVAYRDVVSCPAPVMTGNTSLGADGAILDYADEDKMIFHGYFGLYVYSASEGKTIGAVDLQALGCGDTQGDNACQVLVSRDGSKVYFYPLGGIREVESGDQTKQGQKIYSYVYDVADNRLRIACWKSTQPGDSCADGRLSWLTGEELTENRTVPVAEAEQDGWEQGFCSYYGIVFEKDGEQVLGYLKSASGTLEDLVYVQRPVYGEKPADVQKPGDGEKPDAAKAGGEWREAVRLFGMDGQGVSVVSYNRSETVPRIIIDGTTYDLGQVMTKYRLGDEIIESPQGNNLVNAITGLQCVDGMWIVKGHVNPSRSTYSFYDPAAGEWLCHIVGSCLAWDERKERMALWEGNRESLLSTVVYALDNRIYSLQDGLVTFLLPKQAGGDEAGSSQEEIYGLHRDGTEITAEIGSAQTQERRIVQFHYERSEAEYWP